MQGKLFRLDPETFEGVPDNPFFDDQNPDSVVSKVWAYGLRNSWKINVDPQNGDVYLGEVTDDGPEEINVVKADGSCNPNFGWPYYEGDVRTEYGTLPEGFAHELPYIALPHLDNGFGGDSILAGNRYFGDQYPEIYSGRYFFANTSTGIMYTANEAGELVQFGPTGKYQWTVDLKLGPDGNLWGANLLSGELFKIVFEGEQPNNAPQAVAKINQSASETSFIASLDARLSSDPDGDQLNYAWDFDGDGTIDATGAEVSFEYTRPGFTETILTVTDGRGGSDQQVVEVTIGQDFAPGVNLTFGKHAIQSGTADNGYASRAVDGNTNGLFEAGSVIKTDVTRSPFWEVDLGEIHAIGRLELFPHVDGPELNNFFVLISQNPFSSANLAAARADPGVVEFHITDPIDQFLFVDTYVGGRYVRVQLESLNASLSLSEVRVVEGDGTVVSNDPDATEFLFGTSAKDTFELDGISTNYSIAPWQEENGYVLWNESGPDFMAGFETIRFNDLEISLPLKQADNIFLDVASMTQHVSGGSGLDQFVIDGDSSEYDWSESADGGGYVVFNEDRHDILTDFEILVFNDQTIALNQNESLSVLDDPSITQFVQGTGNLDRFLIDGRYENYSISATIANDGYVVWNDTQQDLLFDDEQIVFADQILELPPLSSDSFLDIPGLVQHVQGTPEIDTFKINGNSTDYQITPTLDLAGYVIWNDQGHDLLYDVEFVEFNDTSEELA